MNNEEKILTLLETVALELSGVKTEQQKTNQRLDNLEQGQTRLEADVSEIKSELADTKQRVILMENDNKQLFGGLYDGHNVLLGYAHETRADITKIKEDLEMTDLRIKALDSGKRKSS